MKTNAKTSIQGQRLAIRLLESADQDALQRLAERDSAAVPALPVLGAELDGELIAAMPLDGRRRDAIADPFRSSDDALALLEARIGQLRGGRRRRRIGSLIPHSRGSLPAPHPEPVGASCGSRAAGRSRSAPSRRWRGNRPRRRQSTEKRVAPLASRTIVNELPLPEPTLIA